MSDLTLRINADYEKAQKAFTELANTSEETRQKIEKFSDSFQTKQVDSFIDKQKLLQTSLTGTRGETVAMQQASNNYQKEIERLIKSGLSPQSEAVQRLVQEQQKLKDKIKEAVEAQKNQEKIMKAAAEATTLCYQAIAASAAALLLMTQRTAELGDELAKTSRRIGISVEGLQELDYAAKQSGVKDFRTHLDRLSKTMGDVKNDAGSLTKYLKENDRQLLGQLKNVKSNEEAFMLLMDSVGRAPDEFTKAKLATEYFGKSGRDLILMANEGAGGIAELREEARKFGVMSEEAARKSEEFLDSQTRLKSALGGVAIELSEKLMPGLTDVINKVADFIAGVDDWETVLLIAGTALVSLTAGLTTFLLVSKGHAIITALAGAIKLLMTALTGPAGLAGLAITGLVAGITALVAIDASQAKQGEKIAANLVDQKNKADSLMRSYAGLNEDKIADARLTKELIGLYPELSDVIKDNELTIRELRQAYEQAQGERVKGEAQVFIDRMKAEYDVIQNAMNAFNRERANAGLAAVDWETFAANSGRVTRELRNFERFRNNANDILATIGLEVDVSNNFGFMETFERRSENLNSELQRQIVESNKTISQRLSEIELTATQKMNDRINQTKSFLKSRADLERTEGEARIQSIQNEYQRILASGKLHGDDLIALERAVSESIKEIREDLAKQEIIDNEELEKLLSERVTLFKNSLNNIELSENQAQSELINQAVSYFQQRAELESENLDERIAFIQQQKEELLALYEEGSLERIAIEKAADEAILKNKRDFANSERQLLEARLNAFMDFTGGIGALLALGAEKNKAAAIAGRAIASFEAGINSYLAFTKALNDPTPMPTALRAAQATGILMSGLAQQIKINSAPLPSAETGGRFIVPNSTGVDGTLMKLNKGEVAEITPRGMTGQSESFNFNLLVDGKVFSEIINKQARAGELHTLQLAGNL